MERQVVNLLSRVFTRESISWMIATDDAFECELGFAERGGSTLSPLAVSVLAETGFTGFGSTSIEFCFHNKILSTKDF
jgi:hypothetical protein